MATFAQIQAQIESMLSIPDDMLTDEQRTTMDAYLDELGQQEADKVDAFGQFLRLQTARAEAMKEEAKRLSAAAKCIENRLERLKLYYVGVLRVNKLQRVSGNVYTLSTRKSERVEVPAAPHVTISYEDTPMNSGMGTCDAGDIADAGANHVGGAETPDPLFGGFGSLCADI